MKNLKLAALIAVVATILFTPQTFAGSLSDSNASYVTQANTKLKPQSKLPKIQTLSKLNSSPKARNGNNVDALLTQISEDLDKGNFQKGLEGSNAVLKLDKNNFAAYFFRGFAYSHLGQYETAIADFEQAIRIDPSPAYPYFGRGLARIQLEKYRESIADFEQTIKRKPEFAHAYFWRGIAKANLAQTDEAKSDLQKAAELYQKQRDSEAAELALNVLKEIHTA
ncbi:tetratricopeptide repeat protein [Scytonema hofmannii FACHB-248]|uniref:Tetratricopeptide repeat protein n=1 Tax=Scytonema hofmannii FACHB-248 TaxID=1842502 RepID=A0ABR8GNJ6_9CYAN|nr:MULTISPECIES: tetratricopeptide repeat protein [Nostocales]MBD2604807.1 tetratricopeptide repeat protein [Scytonema hofmannii FACHB-248]